MIPSALESNLVMSYFQCFCSVVPAIIKLPFWFFNSGSQTRLRETEGVKKVLF